MVSKMSSIGNIEAAHKQESVGSSLRKRDSKKLSKQQSQQNALLEQERLRMKGELLEKYNDKKALQDGQEQAKRQVLLRRIGLELVGIKNEETKEEFLFKHPILSYIEEASKIMLMNEIELVYWKIVLQKYFHAFANKNEKELRSSSGDMVRQIFFHCAMHVKKFLLY
jgi:hypothetical protein